MDHLSSVHCTFPKPLNFGHIYLLERFWISDSSANISRLLVLMLMCFLLLAPSACTINVIGEVEEREAWKQISSTFSETLDQRIVTPLSSKPDLAEVLSYAYLTNAKMEMAYFNWQQALERTSQAKQLDDPRLSFNYLFSKAQVQSWDRLTLQGSQMLPTSGKRELAGEIALQEAIAARYRVEEVKFTLQAKLVQAWNELLLLDKSIRIENNNLELLDDLLKTTLQLVAVGKTPQSNAIKAEFEVANENNQLQTLLAQRPVALAQLNSLLSRQPNEDLLPGDSEFRVLNLSISNADILQLIAERNPQLSAMAAEVKAHEKGLALAYKAYTPDIEISLSLTGTMEQMLMGMINLPLRSARIESAIVEAQAGIRKAQAALRDAKDELNAYVILQLYLANDSYRQILLFDLQLIPKVRELIESLQSEYFSGSISFIELLEAQRSLLALELGKAQAEAVRGNAIAALEALAAVDFMTLSRNE